MIRDKLGDHAKVLSVRQIGGEGLKRFISSPKLEVIAEVSNDSSDPVETTPGVIPADSLPSEKVVKSDSMTVNSGSSKVDKLENKLEFAGGNKSNDEVDPLSILSKAGFDEVLISQIKSWPEIGSLQDLSLADALRKVTLCLTDRYKAISPISIDSKVALVGSPGAGKTTMLCKLLAHEVFIKKRVPMVLKLENGVPNPDDSLRIFCEVIGVTLYREAAKVPPTSINSPLFIDIPGISLSDVTEWSLINSSLDAIGVHSRILVLNGAYDKKVLSKCIQIGANLSATHLAISHFDELSNASKLWPIILDSGLSPYCISTGQNVTGDFSANVLNQMIAKSFPENLYSQSFSSYQNS
jgi:flagellar biosynthesis protein FlhF